MADEPIATGTLSKTPLPHLLVYLEQKQLSGTLAIWPDVPQQGEIRQDRILLLKGRPVAGRLIEPAKTLREGLLKLFYRSEAPYAFYEGNLLGGAEERLNGRIDPLSLIAESLRSTAREEVVADVLSRVGTSRLRVQPKVDLARFELVPEERGLIELLMAEPASVSDLVSGSSLPEVRGRRLLYLLLITKTVAPYEESSSSASSGSFRGIPAIAPPARPATAPVVVTPSAAANPSPVAQLLPDAADSSAPPVAPERQPITSSEPSAEAPLPAQPSSPPPPLSGFSRPPANRLERLAEMPSAPDDLAPELRDRWQKIVTRGRLMENQTYFEMLGVDKKITSVEVKGEFFKLAKEWHPDRLPAELAPLRPYAEIIFSFMNEAQKVLGDEEQRIAYVRTVREGGGTPAAEKLVQAILDSALAYERVQVFVRRHQYDEALALLERILALTKDEPDYHAMHGWILMQKFPGQDAPTAKIFEALDRAIELYDGHEKAHSYKAQMLKRLGRHTEAMRHFNKVVSINPNSLEAAREVRIAQMRDEKQSTSTAKGAAAGLFGKLLGGGDKDKGKKKKK